MHMHRVDVVPGVFVATPALPAGAATQAGAPRTGGNIQWRAIT